MRRWLVRPKLVSKKCTSGIRISRSVICSGWNPIFLEGRSRSLRFSQNRSLPDPVRTPRRIAQLRFVESYGPFPDVSRASLRYRRASRFALLPDCAGLVAQRELIEHADSIATIRQRIDRWATSRAAYWWWFHIDSAGT